MSKIVLITGATSGIGKAIAITLAKHDFNIIICGRRRNILYELENKLKNEHNTNVISLSFDIKDKVAVEKAIDKLPEEWRNIDILINNAGLALGLNSIENGEMDDWETMIDTNVKGLLYVSNKIINSMIKKKNGHIINIGSIAGKEVYPNGNIYCTTKHAVDALTKAMRIDLLKYGIKVTGIHPGVVETEFYLVRFKGDTKSANNFYEGFTPLYGNDIAEAVLFVVTRPEHVNINELTIMPTAQANSSIILKNN